MSCVICDDGYKPDQRGRHGDIPFTDAEFICGKPIYDQPEHPRYGPCRRLHLILLQLYGDALPVMEADFEAGHGMHWTQAVVDRMDDGDSEAVVARMILRSILCGC